MTRTEAITQAVCDALDVRRAELDHADDLDVLVIKLRFRRGYYRPRTITVRSGKELITPAVTRETRGVR